MSLFGKKKDAEESTKTDDKAVVAEKATKEKVAKKPALKSKLAAPRDLSSVIKKPRVTEKAALLTERNVYTFEIRSDATKFDVRDAIVELYKVTPVKVNIVNKTPRHYTSRMRGRNMMEGGLKKAYVYLKEGDSISLV